MAKQKREGWLGLRLCYEREYTAIAQTQGKIDHIYSQIMDETDLTKAIELARSMRGHVAVTLKNLHAIRRKERRLGKQTPA